MKEFNTTGVCIPSKHYMVDLTERVKEIKKMVDAGKYFTINRARQYGKTTTIHALECFLSAQYDVISVDFQDMTDADFFDESEFTKGLSQMLCDTRDSMDIPVPDKYYELLQELADREEKTKLKDVFRIFDSWCKENQKQVVLMIDEVDTATNNQVFLDFLGKLRSNYLKREKNLNYKTFQSVILAGVTDVKHLKRKIRQDQDSKENSPWITREGNEESDCLQSLDDCPRDSQNFFASIAVDFDIDMSLSENGIKGMLDEYEEDHHTGMDTEKTAKSIWEYTRGYPFLVSRICELIDRDVIKTMSPSAAWSSQGIEEAVKQLLRDNPELCDEIEAKVREALAAVKD